jgi:hypothetical protein
MLRVSFFLLVFGWLGSQLLSQSPAARWEAGLAVGQYPASLAIPRFAPLHPGLLGHVSYQWNQHPRHQLRQRGSLGYFFHQHLQHAVQLYTESSYQLRVGERFRLTPLALGGGYVLAIAASPSYRWDETSQLYARRAFAARHNWMLSLGAGFGWESPWQFRQRPLTLTLDYRFQVQGIFSRENIPLIAYAPVLLGVSFPLYHPTTE